MPKAAEPNTRKSSGVQNVSSLAISTHSISDAFATMLRPFTAKEVADKLKLPSWRTVENWKERKTSPQAKHIAAMLHDAELAPALLAAIGRQDLAAAAEIKSLNKRIDALKAAEQRHKEEAHEVRRDLAMGRQRSSVASGSPQPGRDALEAGRGMVLRSDE